MRMSSQASISQNRFLILRASLFQMADFLIILIKIGYSPQSLGGELSSCASEEVFSTKHSPRVLGYL